MTAQPLQLIVSSGPTAPSLGLPVCGGCQSEMRPVGTTEAQYPGTVPEWGDHQCRICDYISAGKDPDDRFIQQDRIEYLCAQRADYEASRRARSIPKGGLKPNTLRSLKAV